jgi:exodeoxyribonuclease VIII
LRDDLACVDDLKTTSRSASPESWNRTLFSIGADVGASFYLRGLKAVTGVTARYRFVVVETSAPFALSVFELSDDVLALAHEKVEWALATWRQCLADDSWPGYPTQVCTVGLNTWEETRWFERTERTAA